VGILKKLKDLHRWADCVDTFIQVVKQKNKMDFVPMEEVLRLANLVWENATSGGIDSLWLVNNHAYLDTYWTVY